MRAHALRQPTQTLGRYTALAAVLCALGGCISSPERMQYNRHLSTIVEPADAVQRATLAHTFNWPADESAQLAVGSNAPEGRSDNR